ncbi:CACTA en-spm transposon protein [Cucumis melo var. makuwa]|uniref:CACTA en-spm transposon protein n=1 Tax=Cucumis melo var. makuwa TaxID=1194695 RepID=A0A5D3C891_CUCMM|nr:CACTA en-spm transposon protein [Cucumis melo var. makuwa]TYK08187.1 CACTA en-spm transposon protein [Cucumis melo var. makuwa]
MFLKFEDDLDNLAGGSSSMGDNAETCVVSTLRAGAPRCSQWANFDDDHPWSREAYFPTRRSLQLGNRRQFFVLDFNDQAMNRFVEHQMLTTFKEFRADCHRHFKKYNDVEEARVNPPNILAVEDAHLFKFVTKSNAGILVSAYPEGSQPLSGDKICDQVLGRRPGYLKDLGWRPKPKACKTTSANSSTTSCSQSATNRDIQIQAKLDQALE